MATNTNKKTVAFENNREAELGKRAQEARERAAAYRNGTFGQEDAAKSKRGEQDNQEVRTLEEWSDIVGQRIENAMRRGAFDNLPGRGKPLDLDRDPFIPEDQQMAFKLLQNNDLTPEWIGDRKAMLGAIQRLRTQMREVAAAYRAEWARATASKPAGDPHRAGQPVSQKPRPGLPVDKPVTGILAKRPSAEQLAEEWSRQVIYWENRVVELNKRILALNLKQPASHLEIFQLRLDEELARAGAARELGSP